MQHRHTNLTTLAIPPAGVRSLRTRLAAPAARATPKAAPSTGKDAKFATAQNKVLIRLAKLPERVSTKAAAEALGMSTSDFLWMTALSASGHTPKPIAAESAPYFDRSRLMAWVRGGARVDGSGGQYDIAQGRRRIERAARNGK